MARLLGVRLDDDQPISYALTLVYGIGWSRARQILTLTKIEPKKKVADLSAEDVRKISVLVEKKFPIEGNLREKISEDIKRLKSISCYRGVRMIRGLPVRGQRTRSNARSKRGRRRTVGALTKEAWAKLEKQRKSS